MLSRFKISSENYDISCKLFAPDGEPELVVIGVHGFGGDKESSVLAALGDELSRRNSALLCFDFPAHGDSEAEDSCLRVDNCKNDLLRAVEYVKKRFPNSRRGIFATSFGGYIALLCSQHFRGMRVVLRAPAVNMAETFVRCILPVTKEEFLKNGGAVCGFERKMLVPVDFYEELLREPVIVPEYPLTVIMGTDDNVVRYEDIERMSRENGNVELVPVQGADHRFKRTGDLELIVRAAIERYGV